MTRNELIKEYFDWMCGFVYDKKQVKNRSYKKLLNQLHSTEFIYILFMDGNRFEDGINLRYRFGRENNYEESMITSYLDDKPCSVLEMLVALSLRCEEHIMSDSDFGNRTAIWFWTMIDNLGLDKMDDANFDRHNVEKIIDRLLDRKYERDGTGGLFRISGCNRDLRTVEIWYQMMWYLNTYYGEN